MDNEKQNKETSEKESIVIKSETRDEILPESVNVDDFEYASSQEVQDLMDKLDTLNKYNRKRLSWRRNFFMSIITGVGTVIGATIVAGILISILAKMVDSVDDVPIIGDIVEKIEIKEKINGD